MTALVADPVLKSWNDAKKYLTPVQIGKWKASYSKSQWFAIDNGLLNKYGSMRLSQVLARIQDKFIDAAAKVYARTGVEVTLESAHEIFAARTLEDVNGVMASELAAKMPISAVRDAAIRLGALPSASEDKLRAVFAVWVSEWANAWGVILDDWMAYYKANPDTAHPSHLAYKATSGAVTGSGKNFFEQVKYFVRHPLKVINNVISDSGRWVAERAQDILNADKSAPWLSQYFLKPLGFHAQLTVIRELGRSIETGSISTFNEQAVVSSTASTLTAAGQALLVAAPFLPPPWNVAAAALGALSVGAGKLINDLQHQSAAQRIEDERAAAQERAYQAAVDSGKALQDAALAEYNAGRSQQQWFQNTDGAWYYGLWVRDRKGQPVPAWVWLTDKGWVWTGAYK